jgi:hypothetical protein
MRRQHPLYEKIVRAFTEHGTLTSEQLFGLVARYIPATEALRYAQSYTKEYRRRTKRPCNHKDVILFGKKRVLTNRIWTLRQQGIIKRVARATYVLANPKLKLFVA